MCGRAAKNLLLSGGNFSKGNFFKICEISLLLNYEKMRVFKKFRGIQRKNISVQAAVNLYA